MKHGRYVTDKLLRLARGYNITDIDPVFLPATTQASIQPTGKLSRWLFKLKNGVPIFIEEFSDTERQTYTVYSSMGGPTHIRFSMKDAKRLEAAIIDKGQARIGALGQITAALAPNIIVQSGGQLENALREHIRSQQKQLDQSRALSTEWAPAGESMPKISVREGNTYTGLPYGSSGLPTLALQLLMQGTVPEVERLVRQYCQEVSTIRSTYVERISSYLDEAYAKQLDFLVERGLTREQVLGVLRGENGS